MGLMNRKGKIAQYNLDCGIRHTELLMPTIKKALRASKLSLSEVDYFAVGLGPGSFTGLRVGLATIKGFALALKKPVVGLSTLDILALNCLPADSRFVSPLIDAKRKLLFTALYEAGSDNKLKRRSPYLLISVEELLNRLHAVEKKSSGAMGSRRAGCVRKSVTFLGDGLCLYQQSLKQAIKNSVFLNEDVWYPRAGNLIKLACDFINQRRITRSDKSARRHTKQRTTGQTKRDFKRAEHYNYSTGLSEVKRIKPIYLYPKECQIRRG